MKAETEAAREAATPSGKATRRSMMVQEVGPNGNGGRHQSPIGVMMAGSVDSHVDGHTTRGSSPADVNPRFGDNAVNLEAIRIAGIREHAAIRRLIQPDPPAHLIRCVDCTHRIPKARIEAVRDYGVPNRCTPCQNTREKRFPKNPDSYR